MLETCRGGPNPIRMCLKRVKILVNSTMEYLETKMDPNFDRPRFDKFEVPLVEVLQYMLETCRGGPSPIRLCVEKTKNFGQIQPPRTWRPKWTQILIGPFSPNLKILEQRTCPTCLKPAGEALGLLGCVLKRLKTLVKFNHRGAGGQNGPKF